MAAVTEQTSVKRQAAGDGELKRAFGCREAVKHTYRVMHGVLLSSSRWYKLAIDEVWEHSLWGGGGGGGGRCCLAWTWKNQAGQHSMLDSTRTASAAKQRTPVEARKP